jgi:two-component system, cell cycle response regulator
MDTKILVVDDNNLNVRLLTDILEDEGYEIYSCGNGSDVLYLAHKVRPEAILLDIMMPGLDGFEVCKLLKRDFEIKDIPVIMVTAKTDSVDVRRALELGAFDYIRKPIDEIEVVARVQSALRFKHHQDKLKEMAMKDGLTGLYNHALLIELFEKELKKQERSGNNISFVMLDIDYFKRVNDTYGHMSGDTVLMELSQILTSSIRSCDIVGRYGGEEFGIILPEVNLEGALNICERIRKNIESYKFDIGSESISITVSQGLYFKFPENSITSSEIIKRSDEALYRAKENGRNRVEISSN